MKRLVLFFGMICAGNLQASENPAALAAARVIGGELKLAVFSGTLSPEYRIGDLTVLVQADDNIDTVEKRAFDAINTKWASEHHLYTKSPWVIFCAPEDFSDYHNPAWHWDGHLRKEDMFKEVVLEYCGTGKTVAAVVSLAGNFN